MSVMNEDDADRTVDELLDWLCWIWAREGERFYPPNETSEEVAEILELEEEYARGQEYGQHCRALDDAATRYQDLENLGFDPKARAEREMKRAKEEDDLDLEEIDWTWWEECKRE